MSLFVTVLLRILRTIIKGLSEDLETHIAFVSTLTCEPIFKKKPFLLLYIKLVRRFWLLVVAFLLSVGEDHHVGNAYYKQ